MTPKEKDKIIEENTIEIVINTCFGGFGLSDEAFELYLNKKGIKFYKRKEGLLGSAYYKVPPEEYDKLLKECHDRDGNYKEINNKGWFLNPYDIKRDDKILIEAVKKLGSRANGNLANLQIVKIPPNIRWVIDDYDGMETIEEEHRSWG